MFMCTIVDKAPSDEADDHDHAKMTRRYSKMEKGTVKSPEIHQTTTVMVRKLDPPV